MSDLLTERLKSLTPEQRALFELRKRDRDRAASSASVIPRVSTSEQTAVPLSFAQQRLWFLHQLDPLSPLYNTFLTARLRGPLDRLAIGNALAEIVSRHQVLRTTFVFENGQPVQKILPSAQLPIRELSLAHLSGSERDSMSRDAVREEISAPFDLETGPVLRALLIELNAGERLLVITLHHIVSDRWSIDVLANDLAALYGAFSRNLPSPLKPLPIQYADFAAWQRAPKQTAQLDRELAWWLRALRPPLPVTELPADSVRPAIYDATGRYERLSLSRQTSEAIADMARQEGATLFMAMLACAAALLFRYGSQQDSVVGTPIVNRKLPETVPLIGCFVNTLVLRLDGSADPAWREFLHVVRAVCLDAYEHQDLPFERLVEVLQPNRDLSQTPLYQVMFALNDEHEPVHGGQRLQSELVSNRLTLSRFESDHGAVAADLVIRVERRHTSTDCTFEYRTSLFESETIRRMLRHYEALLESAIRYPNRRLSELSILTPAERRQVLVDWNLTTPSPADYRANAAALFAEQAKREPWALAVAGSQGGLTRSELDFRARCLAGALRGESIGREAVVAVCLPRSPEMIAAFLGVLYAGAAYLPLDMAYPDERLRWILDHSNAAALITDARLADRLAFSGPTLLVDSGERLKAPLDDPIFAQGDDVAYVIYTSGSTGHPKGVCVRHAGLSNLVAWHLAAYSLGPEDVTTQIASPGFDASVWEIWPALASGAALHIADESIRLSPEALWMWLCERRVTVAFLPTPLAEAILATDRQPPSALRLLLTGGDRLRRHALPECAFSLVNHYGPTEYSVVATAGMVATHSPSKFAKLPSIGRPIANTEAFVLDKHMQPVPPGMRGELFLGGEGLARGYVRRPDFTAERFVPHPFSAIPGARLYQTGDWVRHRPDGSLEFLDRKDAQIKIRGFRIELGEIESVLAGHPAVREAAVIPIPRESGDALLACYVCPETQMLDSGGVREWLAARLPDYMVPSTWTILPKLPLNASGKVDRRALAAFPVQAQTSPRAEVLPRTKDEEILAEIWAELLPGEAFDVHTDFFAVGGHSLLVAQLASRIRAHCEIDPPLRICFEHRTIAALASYISNARAQRANVLPPPLVRQSDSAALSFAQSRLWFIAQLEPDSPVYNIPFAVRLRGILNEGALERALDQILRRHETLRTRFGEKGGIPIQAIDPEAHVELTRRDLSTVPASEREAGARALAANDARLPFDIARGPVLRVQLMRLEEQDHILLFNLHHIAGDAWSIGILAREFAALYTEFASGLPSRLPDLPIQYADYAAWQRDWLRGTTLEALLASAKSELADIEPLELLYDHPRPGTPSYRAGAVPFEISDSLWTGLEAIAQSENATSFMLLFAAWGLLLARYADRSELILGTDSAGRDRLETEPLIGFFVNQLAVPVRLGAHDTFHTLLARVRADLLNAYANQHLPFELLVEALSPERDLSRHPLFQCKIVFEDAAPSLKLPSLEASLFAAGHPTIKTDLRLVVRTHRGSLTGRIEYALDLFDESTAARMAERLLTVLSGAASTPHAPLVSISLLAEREKQMLSAQWAGRDQESDYATVVEMFEEQVRRTPELPAVACEGRAISYAALNARADSFASLLLAHGAAPEVLVGICVPRSELAVIAILSVLKTGAAYLPLDAEAPAERLAALAATAGISILVTTQTRLAMLRPMAGRALAIDADDALAVYGRQLKSRHLIDAASLAYVIFTSGSTGAPKATGIEHRNLLSYVVAISAKLEPICERSFALLSTLAADLGNTMLFPALCGGGCLHVIPEELATHPDEFAAYARAHAIDCAKITPSHLAALLAAQSPCDAIPQRRLVLGGEASSWSWIAQLQALRPQCKILNHYGPTETTIGVLTAEIEDTGASISGNLPLGTPLTTVSAYVLDRDGSLVPEGIPGELCIGGASVGRGYLNAPGPTAARFVPDPYSAKPGARMYRTGDRVVWRGKGVVHFLGRMDRQFKLRGYRIEPGEIESALNQHPAVAQSAAGIHENAVRGPLLVAWFVASLATGVQPEDLRLFLAKRLPEYMTPAHFIQLERLPLLGNGKLDRRALPEPSFERRVDEPLNAAFTPTEQLLRSIWETVLGIDRVSSTDNFFRLGGHSLLATRVASRIRETFGIALGVRAIFATSTLSDLALHIDGARRASATNVPPPLEPAPRDIPLPLSFAEQRLWFIQRLAPEDRSYLVPIVVRLTGDLSISGLTEAFTHLVSRHEILRTAFPVESGSPRRLISPEMPCPLPYADLYNPDSAAREADLRHRIENECRQPFDLASGPLFRTRLYRTGQAEHILLILLHHIISDGWSSGLLLSEVTALYSHFVALSEGSRASPPTPLAALPVQYADFALWQRNWMQGETLDRALAWWRDHLAGAEPLDLPLDRARTEKRSGRGAAHRILFDSTQTRVLKACARMAGATDFMLLFAGFASVLARYSQQQDVCIGTPVSGRIHPDIEPLLGCFLNTLVLRCVADRSLSFTAFLRQIRETALQAWDHQELPFEQLVEHLQPSRSLQSTPLFQAMFVLQNAPRTHTPVPDLQFEQVAFDTGSAKFDLTLVVTETRDSDGGTSFLARLEYSTDLFDSRTTEQLLNCYRTFLCAAAASPEREIWRIPLLDDAQRKAILRSSANESPYARDGTVQELFEHWAEAHPQDIALEFEGHEMSYAALESSANRLAHYLIRRGAMPERKVCVFLERSQDLIVAILAILKAGGAYVPLEPTDPSARLSLQIEGVHCVLTTSALQGRIPQTGVRVIALDQESVEIASELETRPARRASADNLAYVMFTSGSTGQPKGVEVPHRSIVRLVNGNAFALLTCDETFLQLAPVSFDASTLEIWGALANGARLAIFPPGTPSLSALASFLMQRNISTLWLTAGLFRIMADEHIESLQSVRQLLAGGDVLPLPQVRRVLRELPSCRLINGYGPTENTTFTCCHTIQPEDVDLPSIPIGRPIANTEVYLLDDYLEPVPPGARGELYAGGDGLARGYDAASLTAERFVPHPFSAAPGARLYCTGDWARQRTGGAIEFIGRRDGQVKVRGFRVETNEIEAVLAGHPDVCNAAVIVKADASSNRSLFAFIELRSGADLSGLRDSMRHQLPEYMIPAQFVAVDKLPLNANGKVDRKALALLSIESPAAKEYVAPANADEEALAEIWQKLLARDRIGVKDGFFELGGHSLLAAQLASRIEEKLGVVVPLRIIFENSTIAELAEAIEVLRYFTDTMAGTQEIGTP
ncbi:MAG TPA: amino acid adenylation domain-containing protein [Bryobacteraceae bacterium]|nr:amino acid adenylation domain-containing protein [Bryobacteraceae bacterium]